jgi:hypothetical protein
MLGRYDSNEFDATEMLSSSGGLSCPDSDARIAWYGISGFPTLEFNGGNTMVGAGTDAIDGSAYDPLVLSLLDDPTPVAMSVTSHSFDAGSAHVAVHIELEEDLPTDAVMKIRVSLLEDGLSYGGVTYNEVLRDMLPETELVISAAGESQDKTFEFTMDPTWVAANMRAVVFVQNDNGKEILQSCNTRPTPAYSMRYYAAGSRTLVASGEQTFAETGLFNMGTNSDTYTVSLDAAGLPAGGSAAILYDGAQASSFDITLAPGERALVNVVMDIGTANQGEVDLVLHAQSGGTSDRRLTYSIIDAATDVLVVDDDGGAGYADQYFVPAIAGTGKSSAVWDRSAAKVPAEVLAQFDAVVWNCGWAFPTVDADDRAALAAYLDGGGSLFISGQDIGWELDDAGGDALAWYNTYLHALYLNDDTNDLTLTGVAGTFTEGMALNIGGGDGANNQAYPSEIDPADASAQEIFIYSGARAGAIMADTGVHKVVYLAFGFEGIDNAADRAALMDGILGFLAPGGQSGAGEVPGPTMLLGNAPNPFNPKTEIRFRLAGDGPVTLRVYDLAGRLVRTLVDGPAEGGLHAVAWDGRDDTGRDQPSGAYFYRLSGDRADQTGKMMLVR